MEKLRFEEIQVEKIQRKKWSNYRLDEQITDEELKRRLDERKNKMESFGFEQIVDAVLSENLDALFPNARSKQEVQFEGKVYRKRFVPKVKQGRKQRPCGKLGGGKVSEWNSFWEQRKNLAEFDSIDGVLNHLFPNARSKDEVSYQGKRYRLDFHPVFSRSMKTIHRWERSWNCID